jgi:hypothetical protein
LQALFFSADDREGDGRSAIAQRDLDVFDALGLQWMRFEKGFLMALPSSRRVRTGRFAV